MSRKEFKPVRIEQPTWLHLKEYSAACKLSQGAAIERLLAHAELHAAPPLDYFTLLNELRHIGINLNQLAKIANTTHTIEDGDRLAYYQNAEALKQLMTYLRETVEGA